MQGLPPPKTIKVYQLLKMSAKSGLYISPCGAGSVGMGMFMTLLEAEHTRTLEILRDTDGGYNSYHIFELDLPNPTYKE